MTSTPDHHQTTLPSSEVEWIREQAVLLGFADCRIARPDTYDELPHLQAYLAKGHHGDMQFLTENHDKRADPSLLVPGTRSVISVRMNYLTTPAPHRHIPDEPEFGVVARYARGRDYHKTVRQRLKQLGQRISQRYGDVMTRPFADSAPIFEKALAENSGLGWTGKHTLLIHREAGSFFVLGELFTSLQLPFDPPATAHCGSCDACLRICPTQAIVAPYQLDARRCIAYLTIEFKGSIPLELRQGIGNRVFGCDDCQLICPWNRFAQVATVPDFLPRHGLDHTRLLEFWLWSEAEFLEKTEGSPLRRTGYEAFLRNIAIGLGNAPFSDTLLTALNRRLPDLSPLVAEHAHWAIGQQKTKQQKAKQQEAKQNEITQHRIFPD